MNEASTSKCDDDELISTSETAKSREELRLFLSVGEANKSSRCRSPYLLDEPIDEYESKHPKVVKLPKSKKQTRPKTYDAIIVICNV